MTAEEWLDAFAREVRLSPPTQEQVRAILELAGTAAHTSEHGRARRGVARRRQWQGAR